MVEEEDLAEELEDYLTRKGAVELLCEINQSGSRHGELFEALDLSSATLSKRLGEGQDVMLLEVQAARRKGLSVKEYVLTQRGLQIRYHLMEVGTIGAYQMYREAKKKFEEKAEEAREWTAANSEQLAKEPHSIPGPGFFDDFEDRTRGSNEHSSDEDT